MGVGSFIGRFFFPQTRKSYPQPCLPSWLKKTIPGNKKYFKTLNQIKELDLNTVCVEAKCPNIGECWGGEKTTATLMIMGKICTRACRFCSIQTSETPPPLDKDEPQRVAEAVSKWTVDYIVLTSVDRDDLPDFGIEHFIETVVNIKKRRPSIVVECLVGDLRGEKILIEKIVNSPLDIFSHNIETVERLSPSIRDRRAGYRKSLGVLNTAKKLGAETKSGMFLGCGETDKEILQTLKDLRNVGVSTVVIGQYLQPTKSHLKVVEYIHPNKFLYWKNIGKKLGFENVVTGPLVRTSYKAGEYFHSRKKDIKEAD